jgi:hypothetical protein
MDEVCAAPVNPPLSNFRYHLFDITSVWEQEKMTAAIPSPKFKASAIYGKAESDE